VAQQQEGQQQQEEQQEGQQQQQQQQELHQLMWGGCAENLLALAGELVRAAELQVRDSSAAADASSGHGRSSSGHSESTSVGAASSSSSSSSSGHGQCTDVAGGSSSSSSVGRTQWGLAASLAAAMAAGAYSTHHHLQLQAPTAVDDSQQLHDRSPTGKHPQVGDASKQPDAAAGSSTTTSSSSSGSSTAGPSHDKPIGISICADRCPICRVAARVFVSLRCLEGDALPVASQDPGAPSSMQSSQAAGAAEQQGTTLQQVLSDQLVALARRHPVPWVCGNVLCGGSEGQAAVGAVWGCVGSVCGRCRAAWYCCEGCQRKAWPAHRAVCRAS
jgi:hypothetical protein